MHKNKIQIISGPRMGSTAFYLYLMQGFHIQATPELESETEFLNLQIYNTVDQYKAAVQQRLDFVSALDAVIVKTHVNHLFDLGSNNLLYYYKSRIGDFKNIKLIRRNVREKILSQAIADHTQVWNSHDDSQINTITLTRDEIELQTNLASKHYHWLFNDSFGITANATVYYEDLLDSDSRTNIIEDTIEPIIGQKFNYLSAQTDIRDGFDKKQIIKNYIEVDEWLSECMNDSGLPEFFSDDISEYHDSTLLDLDAETLKNSKHFCAAPWSHLHVLPNGNIQPCCIWDYNVYREDRTRFGNINGSKSVESAMNLDTFRELRMKFIRDEYEAGCSRCYDREATSEGGEASMRQWMNNTFLSDSMLCNTRPDGHIQNIELKYLDVRFGNICNLKCRMCGHGLSSTWFNEENAIAEYQGRPDRLDKKFIKVDCYDMIEPYFEHVEEIYFAGGEPLLYPEHLKILKKLEEMGRFDVKLKYNTNLTTLKYKGVDFVEMWKKFTHVHVGASIDAMGDTVEYIRTKLNWQEFKNNFERIRRESPHVLLTPSPTIGILNLEKFIEFERFAIENGWYKTRPFGLNYVMQPEYLNIYYLPEWYKTEMIKRYLKHIDWCKEHGIMGYGITKIEELITRLQQPQDPEKIKRNMQVLENKLDMWDVTAGGDLYWRGQLPHIKRLIEKNKRIST